MGTEHKLTVSIIMATYNREHFIQESLHYVRKPTFRNFECLIIDDGSTDNTVETVATFLEIDSRFKYFKRKSRYRKGLPGCRNNGLDLAKGEYIVFFDDDDIPHPNLLERAVKEIKTHNIDYCRYLRGVFTGEFKKEFDRNPNYKLKKLNSGSAEKMITGKILKSFNLNYHL